MEWTKQQYCASFKFSSIHVTAGKDARHADCYTELNGTQLHTDKLVLVVEQKIIFVRLKGCFRVLIDLFIVVFGKVSIFP